MRKNSISIFDLSGPYRVWVAAAWVAVGAAITGLLLLLGAFGDSDEGDARGSLPAASPVGVPALQQDVNDIDLFSSGPDSDIAVQGSEGPSATVEEVLERGLRLAGASPVHIAFKGTAPASSIRCDWRGIARTPAQRELALRFWFDLDEDEDIPDVSLLRTVFNVTLDHLEARYRETAKSNFAAIALGGLSTDYLFLACYVDYTVTEYLPSLSVQ